MEPVLTLEVERDPVTGDRRYTLLMKGSQVDSAVLSLDRAERLLVDAANESMAVSDCLMALPIIAQRIEHLYPKLPPNGQPNPCR